MSHFEWSVVHRDTGEVLRSGFSQTAQNMAEQGRHEGHIVVEGQWPIGSTFSFDQKKFGGTPKPPKGALKIRAEMVKSHAGRLLRSTDWYYARAAEPDGIQVPTQVLHYRRAVRSACDELEAMRPIPADFRDPKYWPMG